MKLDLDIIIPCYNAKDTIFNTLSSINLQQDVEGFKVYLVNDKSDYDYKEEVEFFSKFFYIEEIILKDNLGPGGARREGINNSSSQYIMFIDSDDILYDALSLKNLYSSAQGYDLCVSNFILERDGVVVTKKNNFVWLHGKMYKREFLEKYNINFNDTKANEDNGFNKLITLMNPKYKILEQVTYVYKENPKSITREKDREYKITGLEGYVYNMTWAMEEAFKRGAKDDFIPYTCGCVLVSMYYDYLCYIDAPNSDLIFKYCKMIMPYYKKYAKLPEKEINRYIRLKEESLDEEHKKYDKVITLDEFIRKVEEYD